MRTSPPRHEPVISGRGVHRRPPATVDDRTMTLALLAVAIGVVVGYARGGGLTRLAALRPQRNRLLLTVVGLHALGVLGGWLWEPLLPALVPLSWAVLGYYAWVNRAINGAALIAVGLVANAFVMLINGATPVSVDSAVRAGADPAVMSSTDNHQAIGPDTRLPWLGKVVPVAFPPRPEVVTPGDIAIAAGLAVAVGMGLTGRREPQQWVDEPSELEPDESADRESMVRDVERQTTASSVQQPSSAGEVERQSSATAGQTV